MWDPWLKLASGNYLWCEENQCGSLWVMQSGHVFLAEIALEGRVAWVFDHNKPVEKCPDLPCLDQMKLPLLRGVTTHIRSCRWCLGLRECISATTLTCAVHSMYIHMCLRWWKNHWKCGYVGPFCVWNSEKWSYHTPSWAHQTSPCSLSHCHTPCCYQYTPRSYSGTFLAHRTLWLR